MPHGFRYARRMDRDRLLKTLDAPLAPVPHGPAIDPPEAEQNLDGADEALHRE
jgi:hypothetical protein